MAETIKKVLEIEVDVDSGDVKKLEKDVEGVAKGTEKAQKGVTGLSGGFKKVGTAMKAAGIGLIVALLAKLADSLGENQKAADFFSTAMTALSIAFNDFFGFISDNIGDVIDYFKAIFDDPLGAIEDLGSAIKEGLIKRFDQFLETLGFVGKAIKKLFEGDFTGAWESAKEAAVQAVDIITGEDGGLESITNAVNRTIDAVSNYTKSTIESAKAITEQAKATSMLELEQQRLREQFDRDAENLRQIRDDETKSFEERIEANRRLGEVLNEQQIAEQETVRKRIANLQFLQTQLGINQERYEEIYALQTELIAIEAQQAGFRSEQLTNENSLLREQADYEKSIIDEIAAAEEKARLEKEAAEEKARLQKEAADKTAAEEAIELAQREANAKQSIQNSLFAGLRLLTEGFGKQSEAQARRAFQTQKALGIAEATINTGKAVTAALTAGGNPIKLATGAQFLEAAAAALAGGVQIATIAKQQFTPSGGSGGGGSSSVNAPTAQVLAPQFNTVGASGVNQLDESINAQNNRPIEAYVVSTSVSTAQSLDRNRIKEASFP